MTCPPPPLPRGVETPPTCEGRNAFLLADQLLLGNDEPASVGGCPVPYMELHGRPQLVNLTALGRHSHGPLCCVRCLCSPHTLRTCFRPPTHVVALSAMISHSRGTATGMNLAWIESPPTWGNWQLARTQTHQCLGETLG